MPIPRLQATASGADVAAALAAEGCAIVERVVPPALLAQAKRELQPHLDATPVGTDDFAGRRTGGRAASSRARPPAASSSCTRSSSTPSAASSATRRAFSSTSRR